jgi:hemerythrin-like domain-containing protein
MLVTLGRTSSTPQDVVELLLECHERIRRFTRLARTLGERSDVPADEVRTACDQVERYFTVAYPLHVEDEEQTILPRLRAQAPELDRVLESMSTQHAEHEAAIAALLAALAALRDDPADGPRRKALAAAATTLWSVFAEHLAMEEAIIFPAVRRHLGDEARGVLMEQLRARRTPKPTGDQRVQTTSR